MRRGLHDTHLLFPPQTLGSLCSILLGSLVPFLSGPSSGRWGSPSAPPLKAKPSLKTPKH